MRQRNADGITATPATRLQRSVGGGGSSALHATRAIQISCTNLALFTLELCEFVIYFCAGFNA